MPINISDRGQISLPSEIRHKWQVRRLQCPLSMADFVALALATDATLATSDFHLAAVGRANGCAILPVANSSGIYPVG